MGAHTNTESDRVESSSGLGRGTSNERYWSTDTRCRECDDIIGFYRYRSRPRPEPQRCAPCAARQWAMQGNSPAH